MTTYHAQKHHKARRTLVVKKTIKPKFIDRLIYVVCFMEPLFSLPQSYQIFHEKIATGVSILAWLGFEFMTLIWLWYGIAHRDKMIMIYQGLFFIIDGTVVIGAIMYGGKII